MSSIRNPHILYSKVGDGLALLLRHSTSPSPSIVYHTKQKIQPLGHENSLTGWKLQTQMLSLGKTGMNFSSCSTFLF